MNKLPLVNVLGRIGTWEGNLNKTSPQSVLLAWNQRLVGFIYACWQFLEEFPVPVGNRVVLRAIRCCREHGTGKWVLDRE